MSAPSEFSTGVPVMFDRGEIGELARQLLALGTGIARASEDLAERGHSRRRWYHFLPFCLRFKPDHGLNDEAEGIHQDALRLMALAKGVQAAIQPGLQVGGNGSAHEAEPTEGEPSRLSRYAAQHLVDGGER